MANITKSAIYDFGISKTLPMSAAYLDSIKDSFRTKGMGEKVLNWLKKPSTFKLRNSLGVFDFAADGLFSLVNVGLSAGVKPSLFSSRTPSRLTPTIPKLTNNFKIKKSSAGGNMVKKTAAEMEDGIRSQVSQYQRMFPDLSVSQIVQEMQTSRAVEEDDFIRGMARLSNAEVSPEVVPNLKRVYPTLDAGELYGASKYNINHEGGDQKALYKYLDRVLNAQPIDPSVVARDAANITKVMPEGTHVGDIGKMIYKSNGNNEKLFTDLKMHTKELADTELSKNKKLLVGSGIALGTMYLGKKLYDYVSNSSRRNFAEEKYPELYSRYQTHEDGNSYRSEPKYEKMGHILSEEDFIKKTAGLKSILTNLGVGLGLTMAPSVIGSITGGSSAGASNDDVLELSMNLLNFDPSLNDIPRQILFDLVKSVVIHSPSLAQDLSALSQAVKSAHYYGGMGPQMVQSLTKIESDKGKMNQTANKPILDALGMMTSINVLSR